MAHTNLFDVDHDEAFNLRVLLLIKTAICERHDGKGCAICAASALGEICFLCTDSSEREMHTSSRDEALDGTVWALLPS